MIILDEQQPQKGGPSSSQPVVRPLSVNSQEYPPPYIPSASTTAVTSNTRVNNNAEEEYGDDASTIVAKDKEPRPRRRRGLLYLLIIFVLYSAVLTALLVLKPWRRRWKPPHYGPPNFDLWNNPPPLPPPDMPMSNYVDGKAIGLCNAWSVNLPGYSKLQYWYPNNTSSIFVNSYYDSPLLRGRIDVSAHNRTDMGIEIGLSVMGQFSRGSEGIDVCIKKGVADGEYGLEIFNTSSTTHLHVVITLTIPTGVPLASLCTNLPRFAHSLQKENHQNPLVIDSLKLQGPVSHLTMKMNETKSFSLETNAPIRGLMRVSEYLHIQSRSAEIMANITLAYNGFPITVILNTDHAPIGAMIRVVNLPKKSSNPNEPYPISISACTMYAPLAIVVDYAYSYPPIALQLNAQTMLSPLLSRVPPSFQGSFVCMAQGSMAQVFQAQGVENPSGENRTRSLLVSNDHNGDDPRDNENGSVSWNDLPDSMRKQMGAVNLRSSGATAILTLDGTDSTLIRGIQDWCSGWHIHP